MKPCTPELRTHLGSTNKFLVADLYTLTARDGNTFHWTTADTDLVVTARNRILSSGDMAYGNWGYLAALGANPPVGSSNQAIAPDGTMSAARIDFPTNPGGSICVVGQSGTALAGGVATASVWLKADAPATTYLYVIRYDGPSIWAAVALLNVTTYWQRFTVPVDLYGSASFDFYLGYDAYTYGSGMTVRPASTLYAWGAQMDVGPVALGTEITNASGGRTFVCSGPTVKRNGTRQAAGGEVGTLDVSLGGAGVYIGGRTLSHVAREGYFDGSTVLIERVFMPTWGDTSLGPLVWFQGVVSAVQATSNAVKLTVKEAAEKLALPMPRHTYQPACGHTLFDAGCGVSRAAFTATEAVAAGASTTVFQVGDAQTSGYYVGGVARFITGDNAGMARVITGHTQTAGLGTFTLGVPLLYAPATDDVVEVTPACDKSFIRENGTSGHCVTRFNNANRFRGFPFVPKPESIR